MVMWKFYAKLSEEPPILAHFKISCRLVVVLSDLHIDSGDWTIIRYMICKYVLVFYRLSFHFFSNVLIIFSLLKK